MKQLIQLFLYLTFFASIFSTMACGKKPEPQQSCNFVQNSELQRVSLKGKVLDIYIHDSVPTQYRDAIYNAAAVWEAKLGRPLFHIVGVTSGDLNPVRDGASVIYWMNTWEADKALEQARTTIYWVGAQIQEADIRVNAANFKYATTDITTLSSDTVDYESLMIHEFGHVLGLQHIAPGPSVMMEMLDNAVLRRDPYPVDMTSLKCEY